MLPSDNQNCSSYGKEMSRTSLRRVGMLLICAVIDPLVYWSAESPIFYCLDLFFFVFSMICIFRSSLTLWLNLFFRLLREIECRTLNFFWLVQFREQNYSVQAQTNVLLWKVSLRVHLCSLWGHPPPFVPGNFGHHFAFAPKRDACLHCCLIVWYLSIKTNFSSFTNQIVLLQYYATYIDEIRRERKCWNL